MDARGVVAAAQQRRRPLSLETYVGFSWTKGLEGGGGPAQNKSHDYLSILLSKLNS